MLSPSIPLTCLPLDIISFVHNTGGCLVPKPLTTASVLCIRSLRWYSKLLPKPYFLNTAINTATRALDVVEDVVAGKTNWIEQLKVEQSRQTQIAQLERRIEKAASLAEYEQCAIQLDMLQGHEVWKSKRESIEPVYNPGIIEEHLRELKAAVQKEELEPLLHQIRTSLSRDLGGMNTLRLYKHSWFGTKYLIDDYINTVVAAIESFPERVAAGNVSTADASRYQSSLEDALKYFGRSALMLSGGALLGMKHIGVVKALWETELLSEIIAGASAGSIVAAIAGGSTDEEMEKVLDRFPFSDLAVFDALGTTTLGWWYARIRIFCRLPFFPLLGGRNFFDMSYLERVMKSWLGDLTFREAHYKTGRVISIAVSSAENSEPRILNYITAPDVYIWSAVCASCSVPGVFKPATIYEKDPVTKKQKVWMQHSRQLYVDGSLDHDIPTQKLSEMFNVNFFLVSQVNPHVRFFLEAEEKFNGVQPTNSFPKRYILRPLNILAWGVDEMLVYLQLASDLGFVPGFLIRMASLYKQKYTGDINILPETRFLEYATMMANPTPEYMRHATIDGEKATWPKMCRIKNSVAIELALLKAIRELREQVNFGPEAIEARRAVRSSSRGRTRSSHGQRPSFLRRRSLSNDLTGLALTTTSGDGPPSPLPLRTMRRNASAGSLIERLERLTSGSEPKELAPQAGIEGDTSEENLTMIVNREESPTNISMGSTLPGFTRNVDSRREDYLHANGRINDSEKSA